MKRIFYALIALCAFVVILPSCGNPNEPYIRIVEGGFTIEVNGVSFKMIEVNGGEFNMGSNEFIDGMGWLQHHKPQHSVTVSDFFIGETEVTQELWEAVMGTNPSLHQGIKLPVEQVSWKDCTRFIRKLNSITGKKFRLPTEAEWEYAARGGRRSIGYRYSGSNKLEDVAWCSNNTYTIYTRYKSQPVASLKPNELGIYDMSGNVWEWCSDWFDPYYYDVSPSDNPQGPSKGEFRVVRGGSFDDEPGCLVFVRSNAGPNQSSYTRGFRLALSE